MDINYKTKEQFQRQIKDISDQYTSILTDYKKYYLAVNCNKSTANTKNFDNSSTQLTRKYNELRMLQEEITKENGFILKEVSGLNSKINTEKAKNTQLKNQLTSLDPIKSSSTMLISDYKTNYNDRNTQNWSLLFGVLVSCAMITLMFRIPTTQDEMIRVKNETIAKLYKEGSEYATKYQALKEKGKQKAAEAERLISYNIQRAKEYKKRADEMVKEQVDAAAKTALTNKTTLTNKAAAL
jgi:hypothetical protein